MLASPPHAQLNLWCLRFQIISLGQDPNWSALIGSKKTQPPPSMIEPQLKSFQNPIAQLDKAVQNTDCFSAEGYPTHLQRVNWIWR